MKPIVFTTAIATIAIAFTICYALPQSYQINVNFIPALVSGQCTIGQFWSPMNMTCTACFCLTGRISRCVPQPGCTISPNATTTTTVSPFPPDMSSTAMPAAGAASPTTQGTGSSSTTARPTRLRRHEKFGAVQAQFADENY